MVNELLKNIDVTVKGHWRYYISSLNDYEKKEIGYTNRDENISFKYSYDIKSKIYGLIVKEIFDTIIDRMLKKGYILVMPHGLGNLSFVKYKRPLKLNEDGSLNKVNLSVNWNESLKLWRDMYPEAKTRLQLKEIKGKPMVYHENEHSDGYRYSLLWSNEKTSVKNIMLYVLITSTSVKKRLCDAIKSGKISKLLSDSRVLTLKERNYVHRQYQRNKIIQVLT